MDSYTVIENLKTRVRAALPACDDLRRAPWRDAPCASAGHCYVASEALKALAEAQGITLHPRHIRWEQAPHWYLVTDAGDVVDATADQFLTVPDYRLGKGKGFLTKAPSARARTLLSRLP